MSQARTTRSRSQRAGRSARRRSPRRFSQEVVQLGDTTASLPQPVRRGVILWVRELLALVRLARRAFSRRTVRPRPTER
jgi:hypothetical protein